MAATKVAFEGSCALARSAMRRAFDFTSRISSTTRPASCARSIHRPARLPPGATSAAAMTSGMRVVALRAAITAGAPCATMTSGRARTMPVASASSWSKRPPAERSSKTTAAPPIASRRNVQCGAGVAEKSATRRGLCCARATNGNAAAASPTRRLRRFNLFLAAAGARELVGGAGEARREDLDQLDGGVGVLADDLDEELLGDLQRLELAQRLGGGGARHLADDRDLAEDLVPAHGVDHDR